MVKQLYAFLIRDIRTELSYRTAFVMSFVTILFNTVTFFFVAQLVGDSVSPYMGQYNGDYFAFVLIGIAFGGYFGVGLNSFASGLRQAQTTGTLEALLMTPAPIPTVIIGSASWSYLFTTIRVFAYLAAGTLFFGMSLDNANYLGGLLSLILAIIAFASIGILAASFILVIKRGNPITQLFGQFANLIGGIYYPIEILPDWLRQIADLLPITYAVRAMRLSLLSGASWSELAPDLTALALFCVLLCPLSLLVFQFAMKRARQEGTLGHY